MKKFVSPLAIGLGLGLLCIAASSAHADQKAKRPVRESIQAEASGEIHWYSIHKNGRYNIQDDIEKKAIENAKIDFKERCTNTRNGAVTDLVGSPGPFPACRVEMKESAKFLTCKAKASGHCEPKPVEKNPQVSQNITPSGFRLTEDGQGNLYVIDPKDGSATLIKPDSKTDTEVNAARD